MLNQNTFMEILREVKEIVRTAPSPLTKEEMLSYFAEMDLSEEQKNMVVNYLLTPDEEPPVETKEEEVQTEEEVFEETPKSKVFQMYMEELEGLKSYKQEEVSMMYIKLLQGDDAVIAKITDAWMKRVVDMAKEISGGRFGIEDVIQEGNMGLFIKLTELCGSGKAVDVEEELKEAITQAMKAYISETAGEDDNEQAVVGKVNLINEAIKYLQTPDGDKPSLQAIAGYTGLELDELTEILEIIEKADKK